MSEDGLREDTAASSVPDASEVPPGTSKKKPEEAKASEVKD